MDILKSWQRFKIGLALFIMGVALLFIVGQYHIVLYYLSLSVLLCGFGFAMFGYAGIFIQRFSSFKNKKPPPSFDD